MNQLIIKLKDNTKIDILQSFLETLDYVEAIDVVEAVEEENIPEEANTKVDYTIEDIEAIAQKFPEDHRWTYQDLQTHFPEDLQIKVEILNHQLHIMPSPEEVHQEIVGDLFIAMKSHAKKNKLGKVIISPFDVVLDAQNTVIPDVVFVSVDNYDILDGKRANGSPDLLVEVWSPGNSKKERKQKRKIYEEEQVKEFWAIFPKERKIEVEVLENGQYTTFSKGKKKGNIQSSVLKDFEIQIEDLMPEELFEKEEQ